MSRDTADDALLNVAALLVVLTISLFIGYQCTATRRNDAGEVLRAQGYTNVELLGYEPLHCGQHDTVQQGFRAIGPTGVPTRGVVCCGALLKACTVRLEAGEGR